MCVIWATDFNINPKIGVTGYLLFYRKNTSRFYCAEIEHDNGEPHTLILLPVHQASTKEAMAAGVAVRKNRVVQS